MSLGVFVAIGDTHLRHGYPRNPERLRALDQIIDENVDRPDLACWLWPGDIFDARSTPDDRMAVAVRLQRMASKAPVLLCRGNHDADDQELTIFERLDGAWPIVAVTSPRIVSLRLATGATAAIFVLPYAFRAGVVAAGLSREDAPAAAADAFRAIFADAAVELGREALTGALTLMAGHIAVAGCTLANGQPLVGHELQIDETMLRTLGPIPKILNHIHLPQAVAGAHYVGSVAPMDWGEHHDKRYLRVHALEEGWEIESCPLQSMRMWQIVGRLERGTDGLSVFSGQVKKGPTGETYDYPAAWTDRDDVRVQFTYAARERDLLDFEVVRAGFVGAARVVCEPTAIPDAGLRAPAVARAETLPEKAEAWCAASGVTWSAALADTLTSLERPDLQTVLTDLSATLSDLEREATGDLADPTVDGAVTPAVAVAQEALL